MIYLAENPRPGRWIVGTWAVAMDRIGNTCSSTVPLLYSFCLALVVIYWVGVFFGVVGLIRLIFGTKIQSGAQATVEKVSILSLRGNTCLVWRVEYTKRLPWSPFLAD